MSWATTDPNAVYQFASDKQPQTTQARRIRILAGLSAVLLPVTIALYYLLPLSPLAALAIGLLCGIGASIPIGCLLAIWTTPKPTTIEVSKPTHYTARQIGNLVYITDDHGEATTVDLLVTQC